MEEQLLTKFLDLTSNSVTLKAITIAKSLITNPSTSPHTITQILKTLTLNPNPNTLSVLSLLSLHHPNLRDHIFSFIRTFSLLPATSKRSAAHSLALLASLAELDETLASSLEEISEGLFMGICFGTCVAARQWVLCNAGRLWIRPAVLVTVLLVFVKDPYPGIRRAALDGLSVCSVCEDLEVVMMEGCYFGAVEGLGDSEDCVRRAAVRAVSEWGQLLVASSEGESKVHRSDTLFEQLCSMVRDMSMVVRLEVFDALQKIKMVSEDILLLTLSKKVNKHVKIPAPCVVGAFMHGLEDEFYEVRRSACSSLRTLSILSSDFACKALNLLVDVLNDDSVVVRLQALETMHHMAKFGHLKLQDAHLDMFLGTLVDTSISVRSAARNIIRLTKLQNSAMFKSCVTALVENLKMNPQDEADIFSILFNIGLNHGSYAVSIVEEVSEEIDLFFEGRLGFDSAKTASLLVLAISAPLSHEEHICRIPPRLFSYAVTLLGRISCGLADVMDQNTLLSYLCSCSKSTFVFPSELFPGEEPLQQIVNKASRIHSKEAWEPQKVGTLNLDDQQKENDERRALVKLIISNLSNIWKLIRFGCLTEALRTLRNWKEELETYMTKASKPSGVLVFTLKYLRVVKLLGKVWTHLMPSRKLALVGMGGLEINFGKLDKCLREMKHTFTGLSKEEEVHLLELILVTCVLKCSSFELSSNLSTLKRLHSSISCAELLLEEGSFEPSNFVIELKKSLHEIGTSTTEESNSPFLFKKLLKIFSLKPVLLTDGIEHIMADLHVVDNDCENPLPYVAGLPIGIPLQITLYNMVCENRLWLRMTMDSDSSQFVYLDLKQYGSCDQIKKIKFVAPFYISPKARHFTLTVSIGMECLREGDVLYKDHGGPKYELTYISKEKYVHLSMIVK